MKTEVMRALGVCGLALALAACGDGKAKQRLTVLDAGHLPREAGAFRSDGGEADASQPRDASQPLDAGLTADAGHTEAALVERGQYLVNVVSGCIECHTPRKASGEYDMQRYLAGVECFIDIEPSDAGVGCLNTRNLTDDETGLHNRSDAEIKRMFLEGVRPNGDALHPIMPYWSYANVTETDADAIVAYLRTVKAVKNMVGPNQPPFADVPAPAQRLDMSKVPMPAKGMPNYERALNGRYLAAAAGVCLECHTEETPPGSKDPRNLDKVFQGGRAFPAALFGLSVPPFPELIVTSNLTPDETGLKGWKVEDIVRAIREGVDKKGDGICPPMPAGPMSNYAGLRDEDVEDLAHYLVSLPPSRNEVGSCSVPGP